MFVGAFALAFSGMSAMAGINQARNGIDSFGMGGSLVLAVWALFGWGFVFGGSRPEVQRRMASALFAAVVIGGVCFLAGFVGPMIFAPDANQGPLLGIFFTGPLGFTFGLILGWFAPKLFRWRTGRGATVVPAPVIKRPD